MSSEKISEVMQAFLNLDLPSRKDGDWDAVVKHSEDNDGSWGWWGPQSGVQATSDKWENPDHGSGREVGKGGSPHSVTTCDNVTPPSQLPDKVCYFDMNAVKDDGKESDDKLDTTADDAEDAEDTDTSSNDEYTGYVSDGFDSDECTHESQKNHRMLKVFFESLDKLTLDEINSPIRRWHCPVCQGTQNGPCAIFWYQGLSALTTHARTKYSIRPRLHRGFLELLEEELWRKFGAAAPGGSYHHWEGSRKEGKDHAIVWPAIVVVRNTALDKCNDKGMGVQELLGYFSSNAAVNARHLYGPQGYRGISLLIFESSAAGYLEAGRLHTHFLEQGTGREAWQQRCKMSSNEGSNQLYGYLATKDEVELFNQGKQRVKYELRSYCDLVSQLKQMSEDNQQLTWLKQKATQEKRYLKKLEESLSSMSEMLKQGLGEDYILTQMSKHNHPQDLHQMERKIVQELCVSSEEDHKCRMEEVQCTIKCEDLEKSQFVLERNGLVKDREGRRYECMKRCLDELLEIEKGFDTASKLLKEKHASGSTGGDGTSSASPL